MEDSGPTGSEFEQRIREQEEAWLSPLAVRSYETRGREEPEEPCSVRTPFQRDRDRLVHSKPFRRLKGKTQVFIDPQGDHYRTRMTHTLETTAISRVVARALRLNEDLVEAIGLGHDTGPHAFRSRGRAGSRRCAQRRVRPPLPAQRAVVADRAPAQPDPRGLRRDPDAHRRAGAGDARGEDRSPRRPCRVHQPRHRRCDSLRDLVESRSAPRRDRAARADRYGANRPPRPRSRRNARSAPAHRAEPRDRRGDALAARVHVRARLPRPAGRAGARAGAQRRAGDLRPARRGPELLPRATGNGRADHRLHLGHDRPLRALLRWQRL